MDKIAGLTIVGGDNLPQNSYLKDKVLELEESMLANGGTTDTESISPVNNYHCKGTYAREIFISKDTCIVGKIHRHEHINVISKGKCLVVTEAGREILEAPLTFISLPGIKRAVYAIEDTVWTTVHPTEKTDMDEIEKEIIAPSYEDLDNVLEDLI